MFHFLKEFFKIHSNTYPTYKQIYGYLLQKKTLLAAVLAIAKQLSAPLYLMPISAHPAFTSFAQKWYSPKTSPDYYGGFICVGVSERILTDSMYL